METGCTWLHVLVQPSGSKLWQLRYKHQKKENVLSFGRYPIVSLAEARRKRDEAKKLLANGTDPAIHHHDWYLDLLAGERGDGRFEPAGPRRRGYSRLPRGRLGGLWWRGQDQQGVLTRRLAILLL